MYIKATLVTLVLMLIFIVATSYYINKEGFDDITNSTVKPILPGVPTPTPAPIPAQLKPILPGVPTPSTDSEPAAIPVKPILPGVPTPTEDSVIPKRTDIVPEVTLSKCGYDAMTKQQKAELLRDIQKVVRNEILSNRYTTPMVNESKEKKSTDSTAQGDEYSDSCHKDTEYRCPKNPDGTCPPIPDMTKYIKKDSIPCFGCSLDY
jgi:hypothetical protein